MRRHYRVSRAIEEYPSRRNLCIVSRLLPSSRRILWFLTVPLLLPPVEFRAARQVHPVRLHGEAVMIELYGETMVAQTKGYRFED